MKNIDKNQEEKERIVIDSIYKEKKMYVKKFKYYMEQRPQTTKLNLERINDCGGFLRFKATENLDTTKLHKGNFCEVRGCPLCDWRKSIKDGMMISTMCKAIAIENDYEFLFGTLSAKNCKAEDISSELNKYNLAYKNLLKRKEIQKFNQGTIRKIEITYNWKRKDFNLHIHFLMAVRKQYFKSRHYLSSEKWLALWQSVMKDETITNIHIQKAKTTGDSNAYLELAKYSAKTSDLLGNGQAIFDVLMDALTGRQLITYNAIFKEYKKKYVDGELNKYKEIDKDLYVFWIHSVWSLNKQDYENKITKMDISETIETSKGYFIANGFKDNVDANISDRDIQKLMKIFKPTR